jgi:hypothetical protein
LSFGFALFSAWAGVSNDTRHWQRKKSFLDRIGIGTASYTTHHILGVDSMIPGGRDLGTSSPGWLDISFFDGFTHLLLLYYYHYLLLPLPATENPRGQGRVGWKLSSAQLS